jgi:hypothetical protein
MLTEMAIASDYQSHFVWKLNLRLTFYARAIDAPYRLRVPVDRFWSTRLKIKPDDWLHSIQFVLVPREPGNPRTPSEESQWHGKIEALAEK